MIYMCSYSVTNYSGDEILTKANLNLTLNITRSNVPHIRATSIPQLPNLTPFPLYDQSVSSYRLV